MIQIGRTTLPVLIVTAHNSGGVPLDILAEMLAAEVEEEAACRRRLDHLFDQGDPFTDRLFFCPGALHLHAQLSRFVVDLNRPRDRKGANGVIKLTDFDQNPLYPPGFELSPEAAEERLKRYWDPFHDTLGRNLARKEILFFVDGHSMVPRGPSLGPDGGALRPAFNLITGGDERGKRLPAGTHCSIPGAVARRLADLLWLHFGDVIRATQGVPNEVLLNVPFAFGGIQTLHSDPHRNGTRPGFGLEFNRALYLRPGPDGRDEPIPGRLVELNQRFRGFLADVVPLFLSRSGAGRAGARTSPAAG